MACISRAFAREFILRDAKGNDVKLFVGGERLCERPLISKGLLRLDDSGNYYYLNGGMQVANMLCELQQVSCHCSPLNLPTPR